MNRQINRRRKGKKWEREKHAERERQKEKEREWKNFILVHRDRVFHYLAQDVSLCILLQIKNGEVPFMGLLKEISVAILVLLQCVVHVRLDKGTEHHHVPLLGEITI